MKQAQLVPCSSSVLGQARFALGVGAGHVGIWERATSRPHENDSRRRTRTAATRSNRSPQPWTWTAPRQTSPTAQPSTRQLECSTD